MITGSKIVGLTGMQAVTKNLYQISMTVHQIVDLVDMSFGTGNDGTVAQNHGIVVINGIVTHTIHYLITGGHRLIIHTQCHLRRNNHPAGTK